MPDQIRYSWGDGQTTLSELGVAETHTYTTPGTFRIGVQTLDGTAFGSATVTAVRPPPVLDSLDPTSAEAGPPTDVLLTVTGSAFTAETKIAFGVDGEGPKWEEETGFVDETTLTLEITGGLFPSPDPAVPVVVGYPPDGPTSATLFFAFTDPEDEDPPEASLDEPDEEPAA